MLKRSFFPLLCLLLGGWFTLSAQPAFINKIPIPPLLDAADGVIRIELIKTSHRFNPAAPTDTLLNGTANQDGIESWAFSPLGETSVSYLGPTLKWYTGDSVHIRVTNSLPQPSTSHWHGAEVPAHLDGGPHQPIAIGSTWPVDFINLDSASTMWYHPHFHNRTFEQVTMGLSGMIISEQASDPIRPVLPHTYGIDDLPIILGDQGFLYDAEAGVMRIDTNQVKRPVNLVNGITNPFVEVPNALIRLRILNGSTRKGIKFGFSDSYDPRPFPDRALPFTLVATDGGYVISPDVLTELQTGPGARSEIVLDLTSYLPGDTLYLSNLNFRMENSIVGSPRQAPGGGGRDSTVGRSLLQLRVVDAGSFPDYTPINVFTPFISSWDPGLADTLDIDRRRHKRLTKIVRTDQSPRNQFMIDSTTYDMMVLNDTVCVGAKEIWTIENITEVAHPFHIHKIFFRILDIDSMGTMIDLEERGLDGPKDDVLVRPHWKLRFLAKFDDYPNEITPTLGYMYHCHILPHEDAVGGGMMHQFVVTDDPACNPLVSTQAPTRIDPVRLFPNPARGELFLRGGSDTESTVQLIDGAGRVVRRQELPAFHGSTAVDIAGLSPGLYILQWRAATGISVGKVMIR